MKSKVGSILFSLSICLAFIIQKSSADCERTGVICSTDCTKIVLCTAPGAPEKDILTCDFTNNNYCSEKSGEAACDAEAATCNEGDLKPILCGAYGEIPHPTICGRSVLCNELNQPPKQDCYCNNNLFIDYTKVSLPCGPKIPNSDCPTACDDKPMRIGPYCYTCTENGIYAYICGDLKNNLNTTQLHLKAPDDKTCTEHAPSTTSTPTTLDTTTEPSSSSTSSDTTTEPPSSSTSSDTTTEPSSSSTSSDTTTEPSSTSTSPDTSTEPSSSPTSTDTTTELPSSRTPSPSTTPPPPKCNAPGETFPDPTDCHNYYWCNAQLQPVLKTCSVGRYYYRPLARCVDGKC